MKLGVVCIASKARRVIRIFRGGGSGGACVCYRGVGVRVRKSAN